MKLQKTIGVLAFHGDVIEHINTTKNAAKNLHLDIDVIPVRTKEIIQTLDALIIPGGESTTLHKLCEREGMWEKMKHIKNIFGTCAGAIMLAKQVSHKTHDQKTLELMDIEIDRNAYGRQTESFEKNVKTSLGNIHSVFIRAPRIIRVKKEVNILANNDGEIIACEQKINDNYYLAACFHPELTSTIFHEYFIRKVYQI
ncbi:MAG: pyridoxal 5'-phosphate synthase glutaminase subunit PdxT [Candidatus Roizmanbacteria bacterium]|nr:pyridoxal 5'-phosphate synthase glutaminase subunit PdxT [Candidatus Roizmanbacteria bacterium]MCR4313364.1 pyridoxal 5'-phosphate synthase glutaminase subunit PdxT [Candidatus Roizmanbacteria bacterium]